MEQQQQRQQQQQRGSTHLDGGVEAMVVDVDVDVGVGVVMEVDAAGVAVAAGRARARARHGGGRGRHRGRHGGRDGGGGGGRSIGRMSQGRTARTDVDAVSSSNPDANARSTARSSSSSSSGIISRSTGRGGTPSIHRFSRRSVWMEWNSVKKQWVAAEGPRDPTVQEILAVKYDVALQHIMSLQQQQQQQQQQQPQVLKNVDTDEPVILQQDLKEMATALAGPTVVDPFSASFLNSNDELLEIPTKIFHFLDSNDLAKCRSVSKDWYEWGLQVLMDPSHRKKSLTTNRELIQAVNAYLLRRWDYNLDDISRIEYEEDFELVTLVDGERYDPTNDRHFRLFQTQCLYGRVIAKWDVSGVTNFYAVFRDYHGGTFNEPLEWDTRNATNMRSMFEGCENFNSSLGANFVTSNVKDMESMFGGCEAFDQDISHFDTSKVTSRRCMFDQCYSIRNEYTCKFDDEVPD
eukprot:CAMPEP_0113469946 /NCGR_PEP_ID=MMETSP0014_2-20120614/16177_1 /TAXON_ID=2857 /ORGANISM="Nitzschia sp." /LENGTH=462 /DNA_ID=CAMNT_0000362471 /DNA_START=342 /DNA_END=1731 /DNA_ORIENTATION=+ /assembly_acc=CAM_ASM_000159